LDDQRVAEALQDFEDLPLRRHSHRVLLPRIWELRHNLTAYDAAYLALAEILDAPLITRDRAFASIKGHRARVLVL
jgi:predicted nucleic acid-binding protein